LTVTKSKTRAGGRTIPASPETMRRLTKRPTEADYNRDDDLVFPTRVGTKINARNWRRRISIKAAKAPGTPWATPHKLRHGMAADGRGAPEIAACLEMVPRLVVALRHTFEAIRSDSQGLGRGLNPLSAPNSDLTFSQPNAVGMSERNADARLSTAPVRLPAPTTRQRAVQDDAATGEEYEDNEHRQGRRNRKEAVSIVVRAHECRVTRDPCIKMDCVA
jgi:hypothetical protein